MLLEENNTTFTYNQRGKSQHNKIKCKFLASSALACQIFGVNLSSLSVGLSVCQSNNTFLASSNQACQEKTWYSEQLALGKTATKVLFDCAQFLFFSLHSIQITFLSYLTNITISKIVALIKSATQISGKVRFLAD